MFAVIKTGGKQYKVAENQKLTVERLEGEAGDLVAFESVMMVGEEGATTVGAPFVAGATVAAEILEQTRGPKILVFKKKRRKTYQRKNGHRQDLTTLRITEILTDGKKPSAKKKAAKKAAKKEEAEATPEPTETEAVEEAASETEAKAPAKKATEKKATAKKAAAKKAPAKKATAKKAAAESDDAKPDADDESKE